MGQHLKIDRKIGKKIENNTPKIVPSQASLTRLDLLELSNNKISTSMGPIRREKLSKLLNPCKRLLEECQIAQLKQV